MKPVCVASDATDSQVDFASFAPAEDPEIVVVVMFEHFPGHGQYAAPVVRDVSGNFVRSFGANGVPETFVIDRRGRVAAVRRFQLNNTWLSQILPPILEGRA